MAPVIVYLTVNESLKKHYLKTLLANLNPTTTLLENTCPEVEVGLQLYQFHTFST